MFDVKSHEDWINALRFHQMEQNISAVLYRGDRARHECIIWSINEVDGDVYEHRKTFTLD